MSLVWRMGKGLVGPCVALSAQKQIGFGKHTTPEALDWARCGVGAFAPAPNAHVLASRFRDSQAK